MENNACPGWTRYCSPYLTEEVIARARTDEMIQDLILAVVHAAADYDMYATGKANAAGQDHEGSYWYFRMLIDRLHLSPQAIIDTINECYPDHPGDNITQLDDSE